MRPYRDRCKLRASDRHDRTRRGAALSRSHSGHTTTQGSTRADLCNLIARIVRVKLVHKLHLIKI